jgi:protein-tyrosine phosphatase
VHTRPKGAYHRSGMKRVLFICTGNYYRSRFAEILFNAAARAHGLPWEATSRGTDIYGAGQYNVGPISIVARAALEARGVTVATDLRHPLPLVEADLTADLIVAVCEAEHRPHLERDFPAAVKRVEFWAVQDLGDTPAVEALAALEQHVTALLDRLSQSG